MQSAPDTFLIQACRTLFGQNVNLSREFLAYLQPSGAKLAYRTQVKAHHPDRFCNAPPHVRQRQTERFREIHQAYGLLKNFLEGRQPGGRGASASTPFRKSKPATATRPSSYAQQSRSRTASAPHQNRVPAIPLEYGMFAYYSGKISYQDLIQGLIWQRRQRPALGDIARQWGWLTDLQISQILTHRGHSRRFGRKAVELNHLQPYQVKALLAYQRSQQQKLGQFFVKKGLMSQFDADQLAGKLANHNARLGKQNY